MDRKRKCMFCSRPIAPPTERLPDHFRIECEQCGTYDVTDELLEDGPEVDKEGYLVSSWLRWATLTKNGKVPVLDRQMSKDIVAASPRFGFLEKQDQLLLAIGLIAKRPGGIAECEVPAVVALSWSRRDTEAKEYLRWLYQERLINDVSPMLTLTKAGWQQYEALQSKSPSTTRRAFVAMWFDDSMDSIWSSGIKPGIENAGFQPYRLKGVIQGERIDAQIIAELRACRFVVADVTGARTAVYYEAGFADALRKPVIWTCSRSRQEQMCFDTRQFPHLLWDDAPDLRDQLCQWIKARIV